MYESIREYAAVRLREVGGGQALVERHADYFLALAGDLKGLLRRSGGVQALQRLARERENLLAACDNALAVDPPTPASLARALEGLVALEPELMASGPMGSLLSRLDRALDLAQPLPMAPMLKADALAARGRLRLEAGQLIDARRDLQEARSVFHALGRVAQEKRALVDLALVAIHGGDLAAWGLIQEAQALPAGGDPWLEAYTVGNIGVVELYRSGGRAALPYCREACEMFRTLGDLLFELHFLNNSAMAIGECGGAEEAILLLEEATGKATSAGNRRMWVATHANLGCYLLEAGRATEASENLEAALSASRQLGNRPLEAGISGELGRAYMVLGKMTAAHASLKDAAPSIMMSQWHSLRFSIHLAAIQAELGQLSASRESFAALEATPALQSAPALRALTALLRASLNLAEARVCPPGSSQGHPLLELARQRWEQARKVPVEATSSDLRVMLRMFERRVHPHGE
jgi:tetratricopeptide (TPR) repeat protein